MNEKGFGYFRSLDKYLSNVGTKKDFNDLRYWVIGKSSKGRPYSPYLYRHQSTERLLCALSCIFLPNRRETVSDRVAREVDHAMFSGRHISYGADDTKKKQSVQWYKNWLFNTHTSSAHLPSKTRWTRVFQSLMTSSSLRLCGTRSTSSGNRKTPAVQYYIRTLTYLPKGSQRRNPDAIPEVEWHRRRSKR